MARYCFWPRRPHEKKKIIPAARVGLRIVAILVFILAGGPAAGIDQQPAAVSGITSPIKDITLNATVDGTVSKIFLKEGDSVKAGQLILQLDNQLELLEVARRKLIWESKAELTSATAKVTALKGLLDSTRELFEETHSVSKDELTRLELEYNLAVAEQQKLEVAEIRENIEYDMALQNLDKRRIVSPIQGTVIKLFLHEGESCEANQQLVHLVDTTKGLFVCNMEEWAGRKLKKGQTVNLRIRTGTDTVVKKSRVVFASPVVDSASGLLEVKTEFNNANGEVRPGVDGTILMDAP